MINRRQLAGLALGLCALAIPVAANRAAETVKRYEPELADDGLYRQPWFMETFLELGEDLAEAASTGKRFAVIWEQKGCPYCRELHQVNFARADIHEWGRDRFGIVQLNLWGAREVTDFDGETLEERALARKWRVNFTPTIQFFPETLDGAAGKPGHLIEVARMPGYFKPFHFMTMFEFVHGKVYARANFRRVLQEKFAAFKAKGIDPDVW